MTFSIPMNNMKPDFSKPPPNFQHPPPNFQRPPPDLSKPPPNFPNSQFIHPGSNYPSHNAPGDLNASQAGTDGAQPSKSFEMLSMSFDGKRMRNKSVLRRTVDYTPSVINYLEGRVWQRDYRDIRAIQPDALYQNKMLPPTSFNNDPMNAVATKFVRTSTNKIRCPIFCVSWTPEGRRLITGASSGEFTLWNGLTFNFETILQAHDSAIRAMVWSMDANWMLTADACGYIKYWQTNMNNVKMFQAHKESIRGLSFSPSDEKYASCSDDGSVRTWDFMTCIEERVMRGHGADVKCLDWHKDKGIIASGSKDSQQPLMLWDPRCGLPICTVHAHKNTVMQLKWNMNGNWLLTASRDHLLKLFDIRNLSAEVQTFKGHKKEATALAWHPIHEKLFTSGGSDGSIMYWLAGNNKEVGSLEEGHDTMVWSLSWHPLGHILVSGSNDHSTRFWTRNRPGDAMRDRYNLNTMPCGLYEDMLHFDDELQSDDMIVSGETVDVLIGSDGSRIKSNKLPGLDFLGNSLQNDDTVGAMKSAVFNEKLMQSKRKTPYTKPIPRDFENAWGNDNSETMLNSIGKASRMPPNSFIHPPNRPQFRPPHNGMSTRGMHHNMMGRGQRSEFRGSDMRGSMGHHRMRPPHPQQNHPQHQHRGLSGPSPRPQRQEHPNDPHGGASGADHLYAPPPVYPEPPLPPPPPHPDMSDQHGHISSDQSYAPPGYNNRGPPHRLPAYSDGGSHQVRGHSDQSHNSRGHPDEFRHPRGQRGGYGHPRFQDGQARPPLYPEHERHRPDYSENLPDRGRGHFADRSRTESNDNPRGQHYHQRGYSSLDHGDSHYRNSSDNQTNSYNDQRPKDGEGLPKNEY